MRHALAGVALVVGLAAAQGQGLRVEAGEPRAFGYRIGDTVQRHVTVHAGAGWQLDDSSLPRPGARGGALELRRIVAAVHIEGGGRRHEFDLHYQVFAAPAVVRTFEIPSFRLRFVGPQRREERPQAALPLPPEGVESSGKATLTQDVLVEAWPITVAPLVPAEVSPRRGLGELRPDRTPPLIDDRAVRQRLLVCAVAALLLLSALAVLYLGPPWRATRNRPFGRAWRKVRCLPPNAADASWRSACHSLHDALNRSAGEVVFEPGLERFVVANPAFTGLRDDLVRFLRLSRREFFGDAVREAGDALWLVALCRRCREAERGFT